jgi:hypothetical protein
MRVVLIVCIVFLGVGVVLAGLKAFQYWRADLENTNKLAALLLVRMMVDILSVVTLLLLWYRDVAGEWWLVMAGLPVIGVYTAIFKLVESRLATGTFSLF